MKNKSVINTSHNSAVLLPTSGNRLVIHYLHKQLTYVSSTSAQFRIASGPVTFVTIAAARSSCHQSVPVPATSAHYPLVPLCDPEVSTSVRHRLSCWMLFKRSTVPELISSTEIRPFNGADFALKFERDR